MPAPRSALWLVLATVASWAQGPLASTAAWARPPRPVEAAGEVQAALEQLERLNDERRDDGLRQRGRHELRAARRQIHRAAEGAQALPLALTGVLGNVQAAALQNRREQDPVLGGRFAEAAQALGRRAEELLLQSGPPYPPYGLPAGAPLPGALYVARRGVLVATRDVLPPPAFLGLLRQMEALAFGDERVRLAREAAQAGVRLACRQIAQLMRTSAFSDEQVEIAAALYPLALDPEAFGELLAALPLPPDRARLRQRLGR